MHSRGQGTSSIGARPERSEVASRAKRRPRRGHPIGSSEIALIGVRICQDGEVTCHDPSWAA